MRSLVALAVVLLLILLGVRLAGAPYDSPLLGRLAAARVADRLGGEWAVAIDAVRLDFTQGIMPEISVLDLRLDEASQGLIIDVPKITATSAASFLYTLDPDLDTVLIDRPYVAVSSDGARPPLLSGAEFAQRADVGISAIVKGLKEVGVEEIVVTGATLLLNGPQPRTFETIDLTALIDPATDRLSVNASVAGRDGRWSVRFAHGEDEPDGGHWLQLSASDVTVTEFLPEGAPIKTGRGLGLPLYPQLTLRLAPDGAFARGDLRVGVGGGYLSFDDDASVLLDEVLLHLSWNADAQHVVLEPSYAVFGDSRIALRGEITPPHEPGSAEWGFAVEAPNARLRPRDVEGAPLILDSVLAFGSFDANKALLNVDTFSVRAGTASVTAAGSIDLAAGGPLMALAVSFGAMPVATLKRLWPGLVLPKSRSWLIDHIDDGRVTGGRLIVALDKLGFDGDPATVGWTPDGVQVDFGFENVTLKNIGALPPLRDLDGTGTVRDGKLVVETGSTRGTVPGGGVLEVGDSVFTIPDLRVEDKTGQLELTLEGATSDVVRLAGLEPISIGDKLGVAPGDLSGDSALTASVSFPLKKEFDRDLAAWSFAASLSGFSSKVPISGQMITRANLEVNGNKSMATIRGRGNLNGLPADIDLVQPLDGSSVGTGHGVVLDIDTSELARRGVDFGGLVSGKIRMSVRSRGDGRRDMDADLSQAELTIAPLGWRKAVGVPAEARFVLSEVNGAQKIEDFVLTSDGVRIEGDVLIDKNGDLFEADFSQFALRDQDQAALNIKRTRGGGYSIGMNASRFDGRGLLAALKRGAAAEEVRNDLRIEARIGRLTGFNGVDVTSFAADLTAVGGSVTNAVVSGLSNGRASLRGEIKPEGKNRALTVQMADAGEVFRFLDLYKRMKGGTGTLGATIAGKTTTGRLVVSDLSITEESGLNQIIAANPGLTRPRLGRNSTSQRVTRPGGTSFQKLNVEFTKTGNRVRVREATLKGAALGGTVEGTVDLQPERLNLTGTFVPAYALNNMLGQIPLLGQLVGGRNGGLLGVTFRVSGTLEDPVLSVNPMSAIAPGIFRKIFEFR
ncbi:AsmA-like C-terminal domain-containing protein [Breoghania sp. L-A4]|uniref:AsmA-like C-terminal domain-containing protein n=1 Tax=Breoghania sp. L-A4 TaxID=2304600 RepID=UPI0013C2FB6E|nr:AsmA-like C-terminal domain-containing protein [Breoghania sp. L-A4]